MAPRARRSLSDAPPRCATRSRRISPRPIRAARSTISAPGSVARSTTSARPSARSCERPRGAAATTPVRRAQAHVWLPSSRADDPLQRRRRLTPAAPPPLPVAPQARRAVAHPHPRRGRDVRWRRSALAAPRLRAAAARRHGPRRSPSARRGRPRTSTPRHAGDDARGHRSRESRPSSERRGRRGGRARRAARAAVARSPRPCSARAFRAEPVRPEAADGPRVREPRFAAA